MSGTNLTCLVICTWLFGFCYAVSWHHTPFIPNDEQASYYHPSIFPDTLCVATYWSPVYPGFGIQEGMIYAGTNRYDISIKSQYHPLMSNHQLTIGCLILNEEILTAGLQCHYSLSALHGVQTKHGGSCSGGLIIRPQPNWQVSLCSMHILSFPRDSTERLLEPELTAQLAVDPIGSLRLRLGVDKIANLPWRLFLGFKWRIVNELAMSLTYEPGKGYIAVNVNLNFSKWKANTAYAFHPYLGLSQEYMIAYER